VPDGVGEVIGEQVLGYVPTWIGTRGIAGCRIRPLLAAGYAQEFAGRDPPAVRRFVANESEGGPDVRGPYFATWIVLTSLCVLGERYRL
jgi:hypothetical protein